MTETTEDGTMHFLIGVSIGIIIGNIGIIAATKLKPAGKPERVLPSDMPPKKPHVRMYRPDGSFKTFTRPVSYEEMCRLAGAKVVVYRGPGLNEAFVDEIQKEPVPASVQVGRYGYRGTVFLGSYGNDGKMHPIDPKWFKAIGDDMAYSLLHWGAYDDDD